MAFTFLNFLQEIFSRKSQFSQFVEVGIYTFLNNISPINEYGRVVLNFSFNFFGNNGAGIQLVGNGAQSDVFCMSTQLFYWFDGFERRFQLNHFARIDSAHSNFRNQTFQIANQRNILSQSFFQFRMFEKIFYYIQPFVDRFYIFQRKSHPTFQQSTAHRADGFIQHFEQGFSSFVDSFKKFKVSYGESVKPYKAVFFNARELGNMSRLLMMGQVEVIKNGAGCNHSVGKSFHTKTLQTFRFKLLQQPVFGCIKGKYPIFERIGIKFGSK
ncbi:MAG: hypothetical protein BWZ11_01683 [Bacteroidetes bacterium ADurb.BinA395]|nr:MAG: hypothetical protein BWZ11_01683 [Bacteroidetes bacterium ADurb.BinA395]